VTIVNQDALDYSNDAQFRVAYDTRCLVKKATLTVQAGVGTYNLAADVIELLAVLATDGDLTYLNLDDAMTLLTTPADSQPFTFETGYYVVGTVIGFFPVPTAAATYTLVYQARPAQLTSNTEFEVGGDFELLLDRLVQAMKLDDDGQPGLAAEEQGFYDVEMPRLRNRVGREPRGRASVVGFDLDT